MPGNGFLEQRLLDAEKEKERTAKARKRLWSEIQEYAPDLAGFMVGLNKAFGKVELEGVWMAGLWQDEYLAMVVDCELRSSEMNDWEQSFVQSMRQKMDRPQFSITPRQVEKLEDIWNRVTADLPTVTSVNRNVFDGGFGNG